MFCVPAGIALYSTCGRRPKRTWKMLTLYSNVSTMTCGERDNTYDGCPILIIACLWTVHCTYNICISIVMTPVTRNQTTPCHSILRPAITWTSPSRCESYLQGWKRNDRSFLGLRKSRNHCRPTCNQLEACRKAFARDQPRVFCLRKSGSPRIAHLRHVVDNMSCPNHGGTHQMIFGRQWQMSDRNPRTSLWVPARMFRELLPSNKQVRLCYNRFRFADLVIGLKLDALVDATIPA